MYTNESELPFAVYAYATSVLARAETAVRRGGRMTRQEAERLVRALLEANGARGGVEPLFGENAVAGVMLGAAELFFEYDAGSGTLACGALVYRFRGEPRPGVLEGFFEEEREGDGADAGAGALVYREETRSLLLVRDYPEPVPGDEFARDMKRLAEASLMWADEVMERVASRVRGRGRPGGGQNQ